MAVIVIQKAVRIFLTGRLSRLLLLIGLISVMIIISACENPVGNTDNDMNAEFWLNHPELHKTALEKMEEAKVNLHTLDDVRKLQKKFHYQSESVDWEPTIEVLFARDLTDDCDGAAVLGQWSLAQIGVKSTIVNLYGKGTHTVSISEDHTIMITNDEVVMIPQEVWKRAVLTWFTPEYTSLEAVN